MVLIPLLEEFINRYIAQDPGALEALAGLSNKVIVIESSAPRFRGYLFPLNGSIHLATEFDGEPDAAINGSTADLLALCRSRGKAASLIQSHRIRISGDTELVADLLSVPQDMDLDWEEQLSTVVGDITAHQVGNRVRDWEAWWARSRDTLNANAREYLQEELELLPRRDEMEDFSHQVLSLQDGLDRLEHRISHLRRPSSDR